MIASKLKTTCPNRSNLKFKVIAIDGPAGAGKSSVARLLAKRLHFLYFDTGAMYRAITLAAVKARVNFLDIRGLRDIASKSRIRFKRNKRGNLDVYLDGRRVNRAIRRPFITRLVSFLASAGEVRAILVGMQRHIGQGQNCVVEGRDIGTVVFPNAFIKFYLDASLEQRVQRRFRELNQKNLFIAKKELKSSIQRRDRADIERRCGPLRKAKDAIYIDTTHLTKDEVAGKLIREIKKRLMTNDKI